MEAATFIGVTAACYLTAWAWAVMMLDAWRRRHYAGLGIMGALGALTLVLCVRGGLAFPLRPLAYLPIAAASAGLYYLLVPHVQDEWKWRRLRKEDARQAMLHLVLLTGCIAFSLPYLWMVFTS